MKRAKEILSSLIFARNNNAAVQIEKEDVSLLIEILKEYIVNHDTYFDRERECLYRQIENALGFRLFTWQKSFIETGHFRRIGATTAKCLKILLDTEAEPLDYTSHARSLREDFERRQLIEIKRKLDAAGVPTRVVFFWSKCDKCRYKRRAAE